MSHKSHDPRSTPEHSDEPWPIPTAIWAVSAAFGVYFCMYGFRKPFTVSEYTSLKIGVWDYKVVAVSAQTIGYMLSKFLGIKVIAEAEPAGRAKLIIGLIVAAELALVMFAIAPAPWNVVFLFCNGLPLGMVFGLVLGFLEGRRLTEALAAGLCASFILADGVVKSVGGWLLASGVSQFWMPSAAGLVFLAPLAVFVWMLSQTPPPTDLDAFHRSERGVMSAQQRRSLLGKYSAGLAPLFVLYLLVTILRSIRADFAPELWRELGISDTPSVFAQSEFWVALGVLVVNAASVTIRDNRAAFLTSLGVSFVGFAMIAGSLVGRNFGMPAFPFMVMIGLGLYLPYVAVHTTVFERLLAMTREHGNIGFLMYVADSVGYLGYVTLIITKGAWQVEQGQLTMFTRIAWITTIVCSLCLASTWLYFSRLEHRANAPSTEAAS